MRRRHDAQRQHAVDSLDHLIFQLYTLSFFLEPALLPLLCRVATQFVFYKPRELDPRLSLRVWFLLLCVSNAPSFWSHVGGAAAQGRAVVLDFVGIGHPPSRLHLVLLDALILALQMLLTTISFEISLRISSLSDASSSPIPSSPVTSSPPTPALELDHDDDGRKYSHHHTTTMIIDLRFRHLIHRLRNPIPLVPRADLATLPLPNTTPSPLSVHLRAILRQRAETRRQVPVQPDTTETVHIQSTEVTGTIPGGMSVEQVE